MSKVNEFYEQIQITYTIAGYSISFSWIYVNPVVISRPHLTRSESLCSCLNAPMDQRAQLATSLRVRIIVVIASPIFDLVFGLLQHRVEQHLSCDPLDLLFAIFEGFLPVGCRMLKVHF